MSNYGIPLLLDSDVRRQLGNVSTMGFRNIYVNDGNLSYNIDVGTLDQFPNANEAVEMHYGDMFENFMDSFKKKDVLAVAREAEKIWSYELKVEEEKYTSNLLQKAESNIEYCFLSDEEKVFDEMIGESGINLINPSRGTLSRLIHYGYAKKFKNIYVLDNSDCEYISNIKQMCIEAGFFTLRVNGNGDEVKKSKMRLVDPNKIDRDKLYYLSFNGSLGISLNLKKFFGFDPNAYQLLFNDICNGINYNEFGLSIKYNRRGQDRVSCQKFHENNIIRYGADSLYERYKKSRQFNITQPFMHDIISSVTVFQNSFGLILRGKIPIANCYALVGDYDYVGSDIYYNNDLIYRANGLNNNCRSLGDHWIKVEGDGTILQRASFIIGAFSSVCVYLGKKNTFVEVTYDEYLKFKGASYIKNGKFMVLSYRLTPNCDIYVKDIRGNLQTNNGYYAIVSKIPHNVNLWDYYINSEYCYGTYHTIIRSVNYVATENNVEAAYQNFQL